MTIKRYTWILAGVVLLLGSAVYRLGNRASGILSMNLSWVHWVALVAMVVFMGYSEGYRGFQQSFSPRVGARARYLWLHAGSLEAILAPFFLLGYFRAEKKRQILSLLLTAMIVALVLTVRLLPSPWWEIVDVGVVVGLAWGLYSLLIWIRRSLRADHFETSPEVPGFRHSEVIPLAPVAKKCA